MRFKPCNLKLLTTITTLLLSYNNHFRRSRSELGSPCYIFSYKYNTKEKGVRGGYILTLHGNYPHERYEIGMAT